MPSALDEEENITRWAHYYHINNLIKFAKIIYMFEELKNEFYIILLAL
jgi:hypothetical protein